MRATRSTPSPKSPTSWPRPVVPEALAGTPDRSRDRRFVPAAEDGGRRVASRPELSAGPRHARRVAAARPAGRRFRDTGLGLEWRASLAAAWIEADGHRIEEVLENLLAS